MAPARTPADELRTRPPVHRFGSPQVDPADEFRTRPAGAEALPNMPNAILFVENLPDQVPPPPEPSLTIAEPFSPFR